jgi:hypothetical protein
MSMLDRIKQLLGREPKELDADTLAAKAEAQRIAAEHETAKWGGKGPGGGGR